MNNTLEKLIDEIKGGKLKKGDTLPKPKSFEVERAIDKTVSIGGGKKLKVMIGGSLDGSVALINSDDESERINDPEGLLLKPTFADREIHALIKPRPLLEYSSDRTYLRYQLGIQAKISGSTAIDVTGLNFESQGRWSSSFYSPHDVSGAQSSKTIGEAVLDDLGLDLVGGTGQSQSAIGKIRSLFDSNAGRDLPVGSALSFTASGNLKSSVSVDAGEIVSGSMSYSGLFKEAIPVSYSGGFKFGASLEIAGDFFLGVAASDIDELTVVMRRASARNIGLNGAIGLSAEVDFGETVEVINGFIGNLTGLPRTRVESMLESVSKLVGEGADGIDQFVVDIGGGQLPQALSKLYDNLVENLEGQLEDWIAEKSEKILEPLDELAEKLEEWQKKLASFAKQKIEMSFGFQYNKLDQSADLLRFRCTRDAFRRLRADLLLFKINVDALSATDGVVFERFLDLEIEEVSSSVGLNLRLGKWAFVSTVGSSKRWMVLKDRMQDGRVLRANFLGTNTYENQGFDALGNYEMTFEANSSKDSDPAFGAPSLKDMDYTFGVTTTFDNNDLDHGKLEIFLDTAAVCGALVGNDYAKVSRRLLAAGLRVGGKYTAVTGISVTKSAARSVIRFLSGREDAPYPVADNDFYAEALAQGMLRWKKLPGRRNITERLSVYKDVWKMILDRGLTTQKEEDALLARLSDFNFDKLRTKEKDELNVPASQLRTGTLQIEFRSFAQVIRRRQSFLKKLNSLRSALSELDAYLDDSATDAHFQEFEKIYDDFCEGWNFSYSSRWIAAMMHLAVQKVAIQHPEEVEYVCRIKKGKKTIHLPGV